MEAHSFELWEMPGGVFVLAPIVKRYPDDERIQLSTTELQTFENVKQGKEALQIAEQQVGAVS
jgi:hypothetical protein